MVGEYAMESVQSLGGQEASPNSKAPLIVRGPSRQEWTRTQHASYQECSSAAADLQQASLGVRTRRACRQQTPAYSLVEYVISSQSLHGQEKSLAQRAKYQENSTAAGVVPLPSF